MAEVIDLKKALEIPDLITSICNWNAARYEQEFDHSLAMQLLNEELKEGEEATSLVETLDALGDIFYVAIGIAWKMGLSPNIILDGLTEVDNTPTPPVRLAIEWFSRDSNPYVALTVANATIRSLALYLNDDFEGALAVVRAICFSNDTKEVVKTSKGVKANITKGDKYVPPTEALELIIKIYTEEAPSVH